MRSAVGSGGGRIARGLIRWRARGDGSTPTVAILGAGAGGMAMAIRLKQAGIDTFTIFEKTDGVGGTWRDNTYPGAQCDIMSHLYSFSFELKKNWSRTYGLQPEILSYLEHCADKFGLRPHLRTLTPIETARWDDAAGCWHLRTADGEEIDVDVVITGLGMLNVPSYPDIAGLERFGGALFHSSRWDHSVPLAGKRVGVVGTGASAVQFVPSIAPQAEHLALFQRTPQWIMPKADRPYRGDELRRFRLVPFAARAHRIRIYWRNETLTSFRLRDKRMQVRTEIAREHLEREVQDPVLRQKLTPDYPIGCKRLLLSNLWYPALCRPNVEVVTEKVVEVTPTGIVTADGAERPLDVIILGTGFKATDYLCAVDIYGRDGRRLHDDWAGGAEAFLGMTVAGYPNLFMLYGPNTNQGGNSIIFILESQVHYVLSALRLLGRSGSAAVDVRPPVMTRFNGRLQRDMQGTIWDGGCTTYYKDRTGKITTQWPYRSLRYWARTRRARPAHFDRLDRQPDPARTA